MTFTHEELLTAVREAGRDRESFTCADVRRCLGITSKDKKELSRFHSRFRAFQAAAPSEIQKLGNNRYRLRTPLASQSDKPAARARAAAAKRTHRPVRALPEVATDTIVEQQAAPAPEPVKIEISAETDVVVPQLAKREEETIELSEEMLELVLDPNLAHAIPLEALDIHIELPSVAAESSADVLAQPALPEASTAETKVETAKAVAVLPPLAAMRTWRDRGQWLGRRFAEIFSRA